MKKIIFFVISFVFFAFVSFNASTDVNAYSNSLFEDNEVVGVENEDQNVEITSDGDSPDEGDENWYDIPVINGVPTLEHSVDYSVTPELLKYIEPGDILYETNTNSGVVMHMALVCDILYSSEFNQYYIVVIEAVEFGVTYGLLSPNRMSERESYIYRLTNATSTQISNAINWAVGQYDKDYKFEFNKSKDANSSDWYCSELIWAAFYHQGIYLDDGDNENLDNAVYPKEIMEYDYLTPIYGHDYTTGVISLNSQQHQITCNQVDYVESHRFEQADSCHMKCRTCDYSYQNNAHVYGYRYSKYSSNKHYSYCSCGDYIFEDHNFTETTTKKTCDDCGYIEYINHTHTLIYRSCGDGTHHIAMCICGFNQTEPCMGLVNFGSETVCAKCNQVMSNGVVMYSNPEDEIVHYLKDDEE